MKNTSDKWLRIVPPGIYKTPTSGYLLYHRPQPRSSIFSYALYYWTTPRLATKSIYAAPPTNTRVINRVVPSGIPFYHCRLGGPSTCIRSQSPGSHYYLYCPSIPTQDTYRTNNTVPITPAYSFRARIPSCSLTICSSRYSGKI